MKLILNRASFAGQPVTISGRPGSTLAGKSRTVQAWGVVPEVEGGVVLNDNATLSVMMDTAEPARTASINGSAITLDPAPYDNGPVCLKPTVIERTTQGGNQAFRIVSRGIWSFDPDLGGIHFWDTGWYMNGALHAKPDLVYERSSYDTTSRVFVFREVCTQGNLPPVIADSNPLQFT